MDNLDLVLTQFFWALVGALLSSLIPDILFWLKHSHRNGLLGKWYSEYQEFEQNKGTWVTEVVEISISFGKLNFKNMNNSSKFKYTGEGSLFKETYIIGKWEYIQPSGSDVGTFMLTVSPRGDSIYGYWVGPDRSGARRICRWVLAREQEGIGEAKKSLETMRHPELINDNHYHTPNL